MMFASQLSIKERQLDGFHQVVVLAFSTGFEPAIMGEAPGGRHPILVIFNRQNCTKLEFRNYYRQAFRAYAPVDCPHCFEQGDGAILASQNDPTYTENQDEKM